MSQSASRNSSWIGQFNGARIFVVTFNIVLVALGATTVYVRIERVLEDALPSALATILLGLVIFSFIHRDHRRHP